MPKFTPHGYAERRLAQALAAVGHDAAYLFELTPTGRLRYSREHFVEMVGLGRIPHVTKLGPIRAKVWALMREPGEHGPVAYQEMARVSGLRAHSTIHEAVTRHLREVAA